MQHQCHVPHPDGQRTTGATFTNHGTDDRCTQTRHHHQVSGNGLALAALLGADTRIGARCVDKGQHRQSETLRHFHQAQCLAITLRARHAEIAQQFFPGVTPLLLTDHHHRHAFKACQAADNGMVIGIVTVAMQFLEIGEQPDDVIHAVGTLRMARKLRDLPRRQAGKNGFGQFAAFCLELVDLFADVDVGIIADIVQLVDLRLQLGDRLLEFEKVEIHGGSAGTQIALKVTFPRS